MTSDLQGLWKPIETAPKDGTAVLIFDGHDMVVAKFYPREHLPWRGTYGDGDPYWEPTHWMLLPDPPQSHPVPVPM